MTLSICVHEEYVDADGVDQHRFGVAVTTRLPGVGALCPFASEHGAVATQAVTNPELGRKGLSYLEDGVAVDDALRSLLNADESRAERQLHGVDADGTFAFTGDNCLGWAGHREGTRHHEEAGHHGETGRRERDNYTVAGNLLTDESVVDATAESYERSSRDRLLVRRLIDALGAGHTAGGDKRDDLEIQSAAVVVTSTEDREMEPYYNDLRVDASKTPLRDLRETFALAREGYEAAIEKYAE
ncbi:DUF1028 domain-containing protein [Haloferax mediterranei ATCC 33500]|uniref:DUF1028 domain-containing protein n=1 Tax=Haloferax mediterranei (strain ATCC 33500 / DSM 1411 / JCM 8866 / NBRC 14739 / NCIMB 2177 / R-4) TaxID=523841 RepID=I3R1I3_HALMT|nr:DUF1028 domain-containing protein [Haloferax mediterranei]AFK18093.2 hypothetical protein HFX_0357 [Haloferax mediterranei ATCC 33500]AHZ22499.1 hypothetical protein BM92_07475 [Haloferax mediterranei ATCC 33500]EMA02634.1 hypothetical protein C439_08625 [Haloferax mediterranei ATCC 33500]MDX5988183.1 DUF1028 domain-containing protein [Haloferax mediterranei ATCC 33500]QCQ74628.1 DUF1028 domain-containing protein [Haloferax mediterranei ATCC 33500]